MNAIEIVVTSGSGDGRAVATANGLVSALAARGYAARVRCFANADELHAWARRCPLEFSHLVCVGGDATLSAAAAAASRLGVPLIPVPSGFGNIFARALGYQHQPWSVADLIERGDLRRVDVGLAGDTIFLCHRSYGLLEDVQSAVELTRAQPRSRLRRHLAYYATAREILRGPLSSIAVDVDGTRVADDSALVTVANVETYRGFLTLTPAASPFDGLLDVCIMPRTTKARLLARLLALWLRAPGRWNGVRLLRGHAIGVQVNGRPCDEVRVVRAALPLMLPPARGTVGREPGRVSGPGLSVHRAA